MQGQGRPSRKRATTPTLVILSVQFVFTAMITFVCAEAIADGPTATDPASTTTTDTPSAFDQRTKPFEFHSGNPTWPITPAGDSHGLSVGIRGLTQWSGRDLVLKFRMIRVQDGVLVGREQADIQLDDAGNHPPVAITAASPAKPGVYEIRCQLVEKSDRLWSRITGGEEELASVKTPWMVHQSDHRAPAPVYHLSNRMQWKSVGYIQPLESNSWETPDWIPNPATKIVPNVKRVGETLAPWRAEDETQSITLAPGQSIIGGFTELQASVPHQLSLTVSAPSGTHKTGLLKIELASDASFETIDRSQQIQNTAPLDVSSEKLNTSQRHDLLIFPSRSHQFVRITNDSPDQSLVIETAEMLRGIQAPQLTAEGAFARGLTLGTGDRNNNAAHSGATHWISTLTSDLNRSTAAQDYAADTWMMHQIATAINRLPIHADWLGYDSISLPLPTPESVGTNATVANENNPIVSDWLGESVSTAARRWAESSELDIRFAESMDESTSQSQTIANDVPTTTLDVNSTESNRWVIRQLFQSMDQRIRMTTADFPTALPGSLRESIHQYRLAPKRLSIVGIGDDRATRYFRVLVDQANASRSQSDPRKESASVVITNSAPWSCEVELEFDANAVQNCRLRGAEQTASQLSPTNSAGRYRVLLPPISIVNLNVETNQPECEIRSWRCSMAGGENTLNRLKDYVGDIVAKLGTLADPPKSDHLRNGDFEVAGQVGIVGWMHTQFPATAVAIDPNESISGKHSVRLTTDAHSAGQTWLVSETLPTPSSGRLAVSLATRAGVMPQTNATANERDLQSTDDAQNVPAHRIRVSLEGNQEGTPVRIANEFQIPKNGQWQKRRIVLEANLGPSPKIDSLRLTIDSLSPGKLWVDDIALHDHFPTRGERTAMQGNAFLAIQGLQRGELTPAAELLHNPWARYLLLNSRDVPGNADTSSPQDPANKNTDQGDNVTLIVGSDRSASGAERNVPKTTDPPQPSRPRETVARRLKDWLPKPIRF